MNNNTDSMYKDPVSIITSLVGGRLSIIINDPSTAQITPGTGIGHEP